MLRATQARFVFLLIEAAVFYHNNLTISITFHAPIFYHFGKQLLQKLYNMYDEFNNFFKPISLAFMNGKPIKISDDEQAIKQLSLIPIRSLKYDATNTKLLAGRVLAREKRSLSRVLKEFEEAAEQGSNIHDRNTRLSIVTDKSTGSSSPRKMPCDLFVGEEHVTEITPAPGSPPRNESPTLPSGVSSSGSPALHANLRGKLSRRKNCS